MIRKVTITSMALILGSSLYAEDLSISERILGLEIGSAQIQADTNTGAIGEANHDGSDVEYGIRLGAQMNEWRTLLILNYFDSSEDDQNYEKGLVTVDYMFMNNNETLNGFQPYIGLNVGYINYESTYIEENGLLYGGQVGFYYRAAENFGFDLSYRYSLSEADRTDHLQSVTLGLNYIY